MSAQNESSSSRSELSQPAKEKLEMIESIVSTINDLDELAGVSANESVIEVSRLVVQGRVSPECLANVLKAVDLLAQLSVIFDDVYKEIPDLCEPVI